MARFLRFVFVLTFTGLLAVLAAVGGVWWYLAPQLPSIETLKDVRLQVPLKVYSRDGRLMAEFGEKRRTPVRLGEVPDTLVQAVLAAEDDRFYDHPGVDWQGLTRAAWHLLRTGEKGQGGSTITMQVARNFFLQPEKTYIRKLKEILLSFKIENSLSKDEILELYLNKIYLGQRAYGVGAAAQVYYGKPLAELALPQFAMIAGLPKAPSRFNPLADPERAVTRRNYVLRRMREVGFIDAGAFREARAAPVSAERHGQGTEVEAPYVAEMVRAEMVSRHGEAAYTSGLQVYTTIDPALQRAANRALSDALLAYTERHGYRGPEARLAEDLLAREEDLLARLGEVPEYAGMVAAAVRTLEGEEARLLTAEGESVTLGVDALSWAREYIDENRRGAAPQGPGDVLAPGDLVRLRRDGDGAWRLTQVPVAEGAIVALDPRNGAVRALAGGFDYYRSKFNRVTQARRQPGSNFKPFVYSAALDAGFTAASLINDAPVVFEDVSLEAEWRPENYSGRFFGPTRLRLALTKSRNLVSIRLMDAVGIDYVADYVTRFGFAPERLPRNLSLALGSAALTPMEVARGYAVFANGGFLVEPHVIARTVDSQGEVVFRARPPRACKACAAAAGAPAAPALGEGESGPGEPGQEQRTPLAPRTVTAQNAWLMTSMLQDVVRHGTARRARALGRSDLAGKTGTTNDQRDAWFSGFTPDLVATAWVGFDKLQPLGARETGGRAALPVWMGFMEEALADLPERSWEAPDGLVTVRIDPDSGLLAGSDFPDAIFETFREGSVPQRTAEPAVAGGGDGGSVTEQLF